MTKKLYFVLSLVAIMSNASVAFANCKVNLDFKSYLTSFDIRLIAITHDIKGKGGVHSAILDKYLEPYEELSTSETFAGKCARDEKWRLKLKFKCVGEGNPEYTIISDWKNKGNNRGTVSATINVKPPCDSPLVDFELHNKG